MKSELILIAFVFSMVSVMACSDGSLGVPYCYSNGECGYNCSGIDVSPVYLQDNIVVSDYPISAPDYLTNTPTDKRSKTEKEIETENITAEFEKGKLRNAEGILSVVPITAKAIKGHWSVTGLVDWLYENVVKMISYSNAEKKCLEDSKDWNNYKECRGKIE